MIESAEQFQKLRESLDPNEYGRAVTEAASIVTWENVLNEFPDLTIWIVHNKTVQLENLRKLALSPDENTCMVVAGKRKLD